MKTLKLSGNMKTIDLASKPDIVLELLEAMAKGGREFADTIRGARHIDDVRVHTQDRRIVIQLSDDTILVVEPRYVG